MRTEGRREYDKYWVPVVVSDRGDRGLLLHSNSAADPDPVHFWPPEPGPGWV